MKIYIVIMVNAYIPHVQLATKDKEKAINMAKGLAEGWSNEVIGDAGELYFNQKESGNMEDAVSIQEIELDVS